MRGALERGTPLAQTLQAQALDAREAAKRELLEAAGRKEISMLVPRNTGLGRPTSSRRGRLEFFIPSPQGNWCVMSHRLPGYVALALASILIVSGCSATDEIHDALGDVAAGEQRAADRFMAENPGLYERMTVHTDVLDFEPRHLPDGQSPGEYAVLNFSFRYAQAHHLPTLVAELERGRPILEATCRDEVIPEMRRAGVTGNVLVGWFYFDPDDPSSSATWMHQCYESSG